MTRHVENLSAAGQRLLLHLAQAEGAFAQASVDDAGHVALYARRGATTLGAGRVPIAAAERLVAEDLACWERPSRGRRLLVATGAGHARAARLRAGDGAEGFQAQHRDLVERVERPAAGDEARRLRVNAAESPLQSLARRRGRCGTPLVDAAGLEAGERLRRDINMGQLLPSVSARWHPVGGQGGGGMHDPASASDAVIAARQRVRRAMKAVGPEFADLLFDVCGFLKGLETVERERGWPARSAKLVLGMALARLAEHYGLAVEARGPARARSLRLWRDEGTAAPI
ncbi:hypothetical protein AVW15_18655 [Chelatococcus daeguensis]|uniref:DUF6456 domain-containing protein n=1 Tax=Chelatococcus daeguensis TaxID=444444 RepID=UPI0007AB75AE|nr:DUF6456 domain-containing protein [Chelatococcus daeguensis]KZE33677.1 hypothetical protein AVW15_18655 [Chelatococcus daeguensis]